MTHPRTGAGVRTPGAGAAIVISAVRPTLLVSAIVAPNGANTPVASLAKGTEVSPPDDALHHQECGKEHLPGLPGCRTGQ